MLSQDGKRIVSCAVQHAPLYPYGARTIRNITVSGNLASLTGMGIWELVPLLSLIFGMPLFDLNMVVLCGETVARLARPAQMPSPRSVSDCQADARSIGHFVEAPLMYPR